MIQTKLGNYYGDVGFTERDGKYFMTLGDHSDVNEVVISKEFYNAAALEFRPSALYDEAAKAIRSTTQGPFNHNIIALILQDLARQTTPELANRLIDDLGLDYEKGL